ncbi:MAG: hypothetical protein PQJ45_12930 [Sphaerochaetaceae bacterium]|nr:hypothetical protein [Sphaerochaetaceae bacterium]
MKKKKISILALFTIILLLSSCDVTTLLDTFKGNAYEEVFNIDLVGEQAQEAVDAVVDALQPVVIGSDAPTLPVQTDEEKEELKSTIAKVLSGSSTDEFLEGLEEEADEDVAEAAENTADEINGMLDDLLDPSNLDGLDEDIQDQISDLANDLRLDLPDNPTQADILNVQLASNLVNGLTDVLGQIDGGADLDDEEVVDGLLEVVSDAAFMLKVAKAQGSTSDLINSLDINNLLDLFMDDSGASTDETTSLNSDAVSYLNAFSNTIDIVLVDILGVDTDSTVPVMNQDKFDAAVLNYTTQYAAINSFLTVATVGDYEYDDITEDDRAAFAGVNGVITYTIATALVNVDTIFDAVKEDLGSYDSVKAVVDLLLGANTELVSADPYTTEMEFVLPGDILALGENFEDSDEIIANLGLEEKAEAFINNAIYLVELGSTSPEDNLLYQALVDAQESFDEE